MAQRRLSAWIDTFAVIAQIAFRNLFASRLKTLIVGGIIFFGALLVVVGNSLLDSVDASMSRSVIGSVAGHIQVYSNKSKDELEVMGSMTMGDQDLTPLDDFAKVRETLLTVPNVKAVVPMGISGALVTSGNTIDLALAKLRDLYRKRLAGGLSAAGTAQLDRQIEAEKGHVRQIVSLLQGDLKNLKAVADARAISADDADAVNRAASEAFWADFDKDPLGSLEFLENRIATQAADADLLFIRYVGTDLDSFGKAFDRMQIVDGTTVPPGKRGFLFSKWVYEDQLKLKAAHRLDQIKDARDGRGSLIAKDLDLQRMVRENVTQVREVMLQLDAIKITDFRAKLQKELGNNERRRRRAAGGVLRDRRPELRSPVRLLLPRAGAVAGAVPHPHRRHADHQGVHAQRVRAVGEPARLRHVPVPGPGEVDAGRRAEPDGPGVVSRALRLHDGRAAQGDRAAAKGGRRARRQP